MEQALTPAILVEGLRFAYGDGREALRGIDLAVQAGECVALIGANGAGKSTLLLHLNGLLRGSGRVAIAGLDLSTGPLREVRRRVGLVFQDPDDQLFLPTCIEDVAFGPMNLGLSWDRARERALEALESVQMAEHADRAPHHLSLGQRKRVAIATVLSMCPDVLALDEPTAGLDPRARRQFIELLRNLPQTRVIATHDLAMAADLCTRTVLICDGAVAADGPTDTLLRDEELLRRYGL